MSKRRNVEHKVRLSTKLSIFEGPFLLSCFRTGTVLLTSRLPRRSCCSGLLLVSWPPDEFHPFRVLNAALDLTPAATPDRLGHTYRGTASAATRDRDRTGSSNPVDKTPDRGQGSCGIRSEGDPGTLRDRCPAKGRRRCEGKAPGCLCRPIEIVPKGSPTLQVRGGSCGGREVSRTAGA